MESTPDARFFPSNIGIPVITRSATLFMVGFCSFESMVI